jgi:hypothetical protein
MATILKARGRMTKDLVTDYEVGQDVVAVNPDQSSRRRGVRIGTTGVIRRVVISDPRDGDHTFPMFYVRVGGRTLFLHADEFAPAAEAKAYLWARRQIEALQA